MKRIMWTGFAAAVALCAFHIRAEAQQDFSKVEVTTIDAGHGFYVLQGSGGNITIAPTVDGVLMIDAQFAPLHDKIKAAMDKASGGKPIRYLINTHFHGDHTDGNDNFAKDGAVIVSQENLRKRLGGGAVNAQGAPVPARNRAALASITYADTMTIRLGDKTAELIHMPPAHTDGDTYVYFRTENVLVSGHIFSTSRFPNIDVRNGGSIDGMIAADDRLLNLVNDDTVIVPGHGPLAKKADLVAFREMLVTARERVSKLIAEGKSEDETVEAKPLADVEAKRANNPLTVSRDQFTRLVYRSLKARG
jgi:glyoxylase-like metal-dependent hydrolase (beta-lactamase superfamily II)